MKEYIPFPDEQNLRVLFSHSENHIGTGVGKAAAHALQAFLPQRIPIPMFHT